MLGIDLSKDKLDTALLDPATGRFPRQRVVGNDLMGIRRLLQDTPPEVPWVVEPTGR